MRNVLTVFTGPIFVKPWTREEETAGRPAAFDLGFLSLNDTVSGGVRA